MSVIPADVPAAAEILGRAGGENFPVASLLFPRDVRPHLMSVYGFARLVDQLGDDAAGDRTALLDWLDGELNAIYGGGRPEHPLLRRLAWTVRARDLPRGPFDRLVLANRRDQSVSRYETFDDLLGYCDLSANPVGELVLLVVGAAGPHRIALSDRTCTGLQLVEFWQDLGEDAARGRVYVPLEDLARFDYSVEELTAGVRDRRFVALMAFEAERTRGLLAEGRALAATLRGRVRLAVRLFTAGGMAALDDLQRRGYDTFGSNAHASNARRAWFAAVELLGRGS
ncbi:MAG TPA: squalene synthase HpnC [Actinomycetota bacterium]|jgi:squalene synthase HpnC